MCHSLTLTGWQHLIFPVVFVTMNEATIHIYYMILCEHVFISQGWMSRVQLLSHLLGEYLIFWRKRQTFPKWLYHLNITTSNIWVICSLYILTSIWRSQFFIFFPILVLQVSLVLWGQCLLSACYKLHFSKVNPIFYSPPL